MQDLYLYLQEGLPLVGHLVLVVWVLQVPPGPPGPPGCPRPPEFGGGFGLGLGFGFRFGLRLGPPKFGGCGFPCRFLPGTTWSTCPLGGLPCPGAPLRLPPLAGTPQPGAALPCALLFGAPLMGATPHRAHPLPGLPLFVLLLLFGCLLLGAYKSLSSAAPDTVKHMLYLLTVGDCP